MRFIKKAFLVGIFFFGPVVLCAQNLSRSIQQDNLLRRLIDDVDSIATGEARQDIYPENIQGTSIISVYNTMEALSYDTSSNYGPLLNEVTAEKEAAEDDFGLSFRSGYRENIEEGIFSGGDIYYLRRFNAGLQWDLLSGGWLESHKRAEELEVREKIVSQNIKQQRANEQYERLYNRVIYLFNLQKIDVIQEYLTLLDKNLELMQRLHYLDYEPWESVLELSELKARLQNDLASYQNYNSRVEASVPDSLLSQLRALDAAKLPLLQIDVDAVTAANDTSFSRGALTDEDLEKLNYNFFNDVSLAAYADYNIYDGTGNALNPENIGGREYFSVGLNLSIPLPTNTREKKKMVEQRKKRYLNTQQREQYSENKEIANTYYEYKYKTQQFIQLYKDYQSRQEMIGNYTTLKNLGDSGYSVQRMVHVLLQRYAVVLQMIDLKQQMYLQVIDMDKYLADESIMEFASTLDLSSVFPSKSVQADGIYIWSDTFAENRNEVLLSFLNNLDVTTVYLSTGSDSTLLGKAPGLINAAKKEGIEFHLLAGDVEWLESENQQMKLKNLAEQASEYGFSGIHLDVEPHILDDWDAQRARYEQNYVSLLENAKEITSANNLSLSVSIPHFYDSILQEINQAADDIVVMVYETTDFEVLQRRIEAESRRLGTKLHVAVRPSDFANFDDLNRFVQKIRRETAVQEVILHDAGSLMNIEEEGR